MNKESKNNFEKLGSERLIAKVNHLEKIIPNKKSEYYKLQAEYSTLNAELQSLKDLYKQGDYYAVDQAYAIVKSIDPVYDYNQIENIPIEAKGNLVAEYLSDIMRKLLTDTKIIEEKANELTQLESTRTVILKILGTRGFRETSKILKGGENIYKKIEPIIFPGSKQDFAEMVFNDRFINHVETKSIVRRLSKGFIFEDWSEAQRYDYIRQYKKRNCHTD